MAADGLGDLDPVDVDDDPEVVVLGVRGPPFTWEAVSRLAGRQRV